MYIKCMEVTNMEQTTLSANGYRLLQLINDRTEWEGDERPGAKLIHYYVPKFGDGASGPGDAATLRSLEKKRLIRPQLVTRYSYAITEEGIAALAQHVCEHGFGFNSSCQSCQREIVGA
jgi:hypothetical protein